MLRLVGFLVLLALSATVVFDAPVARAQDETAVLRLSVFVVGEDESLMQVDVRRTSDDALLGTTFPPDLVDLPVAAGPGSAYFDLPAEWIVDAIECRGGAVGSPGGLRPEAPTVHIDYDLASGALAECQAAILLPTGEPGVWGDVNCDDFLDVIDALVIAQYVTGIRSPVDACPANVAGELHVGRADVNNDGLVDIIDALEAARCEARIAAARCQSVSRWTSLEEYPLAWPREIVAAADGTLHVNTRDHVERISPDGSRSQFGSFTHGNGLFRTPNGDFWATDSRGPNTVHRFDADGVEQLSFGSQGSEPGQFECPNSIHVDGGEVFVLEGDNDRIQVFDLQGAFLRQWGGTGSDPGQFDIDCGTASLVMFDGEVFVTDCRNTRVQVFDRDGSFLRQWSVEDRIDNWAALCPSGIAADASGRIYVADEYHWIRVYSRDGELLGRVWSHYLDWKHGIVGAWDEDQRFDEIYALEVNAEGTKIWASLNQVPQRVVMFDRNPEGLVD